MLYKKFEREKERRKRERERTERKLPVYKRVQVYPIVHVLINLKHFLWNFNVSYIGYRSNIVNKKETFTM